MRLLVAALLLAPLVLHAQPRQKKVFLSADLEGVAGVVQPAQLGARAGSNTSARGSG
jgi:hypothetical protein